MATQDLDNRITPDIARLRRRTKVLYFWLTTLPSGATFRSSFCVPVTTCSLPPMAEAMKPLPSHSFDVVVTDAVMLNLSGHELCRFYSTERLSHLPLVLLERADPKNAEAQQADVFRQSQFRRRVCLRFGEIASDVLACRSGSEASRKNLRGSDKPKLTDIE
jgi:CheY-like chemotaxis protein